jgi:hypothetical protein
MMTICTLGIGYVICLYLFKEKTERKYATRLFRIVFFVYVVFAVIYYLSFVYAPNTFNNYITDQAYFYELSEQWSQYDIYEMIYRYFNTRITHPLYALYTGSVARFAHTFLDGNNILLQLLASVNTGAFSSILIYKMLLSFNIDRKNAFKYALLFALISEWGYYSIQILRDIHIAFFYLCGFLIIIKPITLRGLISLGLIDFFVFGLRFVHGVFFLFFIFFYIYTNIVKNKNVLRNLIAVTILLLILYPFISGLLSIGQDTIEYYNEYSLNSYERFNYNKGHGTVFKLKKLPTPIKEVAMFIFMEFQPFPCWIYLKSSRYTSTTLQYIFNSRSALTIFFWFPLIFSMLYWLIIKKIYRQLPLLLLGLLGLSMALVVSASAEITTRRVLCVYPIFLLVYVIIRTKYIPQTKQKYPFYLGLSLTIMVHLVYLYL